MTLLRCADAAEARQEPLAGTASRASRFVLIEHPGPWPGKAVEAFGSEVRESLSGLADAKVLLMRRPHRDDRPAGVRRWAIADARSHRVCWGSWEHEADLLAIAPTASASRDDWQSDPLILVCTHARHDACCGIRGKPVATALAERFGAAVWTCSHVGGHRFAANVVLPLDGTYYGRLNAVGAADVMERHLAGEVAAEHLRGFSWLHPAAQVVAAEVHRRWGPAGADDVLDTTVREIEPGRWSVELTCGGPLPSLLTAELAAHETDPVALSCGADLEPVTTFTVVSIDAEDLG